MRSHRFTLVLLALLLTLLGQGTAHAQLALPPGLGIRLLEAPAAAADDPRAQIYVIDHVPPGTVVERRIEITNGDPDAFEVALYPVRADVTDIGFVADPARGHNDLASWTTVDPSARTLQPGERATATVRIEVPQDATAGERYGVVYAERGATAGGPGLAMSARVGVRIYLSVGEGAAPAPDFVVDGLTATRTEDEQPVLRATVRNTGGRALDLRGEMALSDGPGGTSAGSFEVTDVVTVAPGHRADVAVALDPALPRGRGLPPWT